MISTNYRRPTKHQWMRRGVEYERTRLDILDISVDQYIFDFELHKLKTFFYHFFRIDF